MRIFGVVKNNAGLLLLSVVTAVVSTVLFTARADAANLGVVLCGDRSTITVTQPESDTIVTKADLTMKGSVGQAAQIEVLLDDAFNNVVPLNLGQTTFETTVQLTPGTHTIKLTAINMCDSGDDASVTLVVTYSSPPDRNADGEVINPGGDGINNSGQLSAPQGAGGLLEPLRGLVDSGLKTLDIRSFSDAGRYSQLSITRAIVLIIGIYLVAFGPSIAMLVRFASTLPFIRTIKNEKTLRIKAARWSIRIAGGILFVAALLL